MRRLSWRRVVLRPHGLRAPLETSALPGSTRSADGAESERCLTKRKLQREHFCCRFGATKKTCEQGLFIDCGGLFIATLAIELKTKTRISTFAGKYPFARS